MSKVAVVYWSGTGNTEAMAMAVAEGAKGKGAEVSCDHRRGVLTGAGRRIFRHRLWLPSMGSEQLEESEFEPMFTACEGKLRERTSPCLAPTAGGDGEWMRSWEERCNGNGANLVCESVICNEAPDDDALAACRELGASLA